MSVASLLLSRPRSAQAVSLSRIRPGIDATRTVRSFSISIKTDDSNASSKTRNVHDDVPAGGPCDGSVGRCDSPERNEIDWNGEAASRMGVDQSLRHSSVCRKIPGCNQLFREVSELFPVFDCDSEIDVTCSATGPEGMNVHQNEIAGRGAQQEIRTIHCVGDWV